MGREPVGVGDLVRGCAMTAQARRIDETRLRRALSRVLAPALAAKVVDEATIADDEPVPTWARFAPATKGFV